jgi:AI-2 transport protein TqsA
MGRHRLCLELSRSSDHSLATLLPTLFAAAQYESFSPAIVMFIGLNVVQFVVGSYIEPRITGAAISISPFMVLFAVFFWAMLWGIAGAFIGVPILIALASLCARNPATRAIAIALSADRPVHDRAVRSGCIRWVC